MNTKIDEEIFILYTMYFRGAKIIGNYLYIEQPIFNSNTREASFRKIKLSIIEKYKVE